MSFFNTTGIQSMANIKYGSIAATGTLKGIPDIQKKKSVYVSQLNVIRNHIIPQLKPLQHVHTFTNTRLELGPSECGKANIVRCFQEVEGHFEKYFTNEESFRFCNELASKNGIVMFNLAMSSIYQLSNQQKEILKQLGILVAQIEKIRRENEEEKRMLKQQYDTLLQQYTMISEGINAITHQKFTTT
jgi:flagellar capping protein FliD